MKRRQGIAQAAGCVAALKSRSCSVRGKHAEGEVYIVTEANNGMCAMVSAFRFRDGGADHMAKEWALMQLNEKMPCAREKNVLVNGVPTAHSKYLETVVCCGSGINEEPCAGKPHAGICEGAAP